MSYLYSDGNLMNNTESILQIMKAQQAEKRAFGNSVLEEVRNDSFSKTTNPVDKKTSVNNADDGEISFKEKITNFGKGLVSPVKNMFSSPKNIALTALSVAGGDALIAITGGAAAPVMVAAGLIGGGVQIGKGIYKQANATTDEQARQAWQQMGAGTFTVGVSAAGAKSALKANGVDVSGMSTLKAGAKCIVDTPKNIVKGVSTASGKISAFMSSSSAAETSSSVTGSETSSKTPEKTTVDTPETKPASEPSKKTETVDTSTTKTVAETPETPVEIVTEMSETPIKKVVETSEIETPRASKETTTSEIETVKTPTEPSSAEMPKTIAVDTTATTAETSISPKTADSAPKTVNVEVPEMVATETSISTPKSAPKTVAKQQNYTQEVLLPNARIVKIDMTPKSYSEIILDKYKMAVDKAKVQEIPAQNANTSKTNVSILNKLKDIFKVFGFFKPKKI